MSNEREFRVAVVGRSWLGGEVLARVAASGCECCLISETGDTLATDRAEMLGLPVIVKPAHLPILTADFPWRPDLIVSAHSFRILPDWLIQWARLGAVGYHPSLLPAYRGRRAVQDALNDGARITGGSVYWLTDTVDGGPVVIANDRKLQEAVQIIPSEAASSLWRRALAPLGADLLAEAVTAFERGFKQRFTV